MLYKKTFRDQLQVRCSGHFRFVKEAVAQSGVQEGISRGADPPFHPPVSAPPPVYPDVRTPTCRKSWSGWCRPRTIYLPSRELSNDAAGHIKNDHMFGSTLSLIISGGELLSPAAANEYFAAGICGNGPLAPATLSCGS